MEKKDTFVALNTVFTLNRIARTELHIYIKEMIKVSISKQHVDQNN